MVAANLAPLIIADTSVWIDHFRRGNPKLVELLAGLRIATHEFVIGELILGTLPRLSPEADALRTLPIAPTLDHDACVQFVETHALIGKGLGWVDVHILSATASTKAKLWTLDRAVRRVAESLDISDVP